MKPPLKFGCFYLCMIYSLNNNVRACVMLALVYELNYTDKRYPCPRFVWLILWLYLEQAFNHYLTNWGRVTHICVSKLTIIGSDNGLSPGRRQAIIWTNYGILLIGPLGTIFSEILIKIYSFLFKKMILKMSSGKWLSFCLGLSVLSQRQSNPVTPVQIGNYMAHDNVETWKSLRITGLLCGESKHHIQLNLYLNTLMFKHQHFPQTVGIVIWQLWHEIQM